jgi:glycosyltransferase involved in cell wall biosynthesis
MLNVSARLNTKTKTETIFGYAARIETGKGPLVLAEALASLRRTRQDVIVRLAGTGPALQEVKARARELELNGSWELVGSYEGVLGCSAFMRTIDVFVLPSFAEGTSKSIIEAMAHGLPIITTNVGGSPDLITAEAGILVPPGDSAALAKAMERLAGDPVLRKTMGQAARDRYLKLFAPHAVMSMLVSTYSQVAGNGHVATAKTLATKHPWAVDNNYQVRSVACGQIN